MKRPNIQRMKRHSAMSAPDMIDRLFDPWELTPGNDVLEYVAYNRWLGSWVSKMNIKHPGKIIKINAYSDALDVLYPGQVRIVAEVRK